MVVLRIVGVSTHRIPYAPGAAMNRESLISDLVVLVTSRAQQGDGTLLYADEMVVETELYGTLDLSEGGQATDEFQRAATRSLPEGQAWTWNEDGDLVVIVDERVYDYEWDTDDE